MLTADSIQETQREHWIFRMRNEADALLRGRVLGD